MQPAVLDAVSKVVAPQTPGTARCCVPAGRCRGTLADPHQGPHQSCNFLALLTFNFFGHSSPRRARRRTAKVDPFTAAAPAIRDGADRQSRSWHTARRLLSLCDLAPTRPSARSSRRNKRSWLAFSTEPHAVSDVGSERRTRCLAPTVVTHKPPDSPMCYRFRRPPLGSLKDRRSRGRLFPTYLRRAAAKAAIR